MEINYKLNEIEQVALKLIKSFKSKTILFYGDLGVGKTTLIKTLVKILGSSDEVSSPTFSIVNEYNLKSDKIFHFDLYRINNEEELYDFGFEDYVSNNNWVFIEWPNIALPILIDDYDQIEIKTNQKLDRKLKLTN